MGATPQTLTLNQLPSAKPSSAGTLGPPGVTAPSAADGSASSSRTRDAPHTYTSFQPERLDHSSPAMGSSRHDRGTSLLQPARAMPEAHQPIQQEQGPDWATALENVEHAAIAMDSLRSLMSDAVFLDEDAFANATTLSLYQQRIQASSRGWDAACK